VTAAAAVTAPVAIEARGWGWRHATRKAWAVRGLDLRIAAGERVLLLGPSGAGKSTLLAGLAGLLDPEVGEQQGTLLLDGVAARRARVEGVRAGRARAGLLLQDPEAQTVSARCGDDVAFGLENHAVPRDELWRRVDGALAGVGFPYGREHPTAALSGGQRQRLALAGVLALAPGLLLLDEPTAMLDPDGRGLIRGEVLALLGRTGATCVLVEHRVGPWLSHVDRVVVLAPGGGAVADGPPGQVLATAGPALAAQGVWLPGWTPPLTRRSAAAAAPVLSADGLAAGRPGRAEPVVRDVDLALAPGRALALLGPNGAGKSTLALALAGLAAPARGRLVAAPALAEGAGPQPHRWPARRLITRIGTVFQDPQHQFVAGTVADELAVGPARAGVPAADTAARVQTLLERLGLAKLARANPFTLSGGEQRRLSVATVLATRPKVLVLDEPTFGQDALTWAGLVELLAGLLDEGAAVALATHDEALVAALADDVLRLEAGRPVVTAGGRR
jgi:energy-coupling factor transport system ATP-binding protein